VTDVDQVIISALSSPEVLTDDGFLKFAMALGLYVTRQFACRLLTRVACSSTECLGAHLGGYQTANLGDGNGNVNQIMELRENYPVGGTCEESLIGGNHLRMFRQNGTGHDTGALFLACVTYLTRCVWFLSGISQRF
jgi:hypothetical protein